MATKTLTKEQWAEVEGQCSNPYCTVKLLIDGYNVALHTGISRMRLYIAAYVNGEIKGSWTHTECEERRRFLYEYSKFVYSAKSRAAAKKLSKRIQKEYWNDVDQKLKFYTPFWPSFKPLKRHLEKHNDSIELLEG